MASQQHYGKIKWYNHKRGFGFITDTSTKTFFVHLVHFSGLKRSLQRRLPREGEKVHFTVCEGDKGPEARLTARTGNDPAKPSASSPKTSFKTWDMEAKISACICTAKVLAGNNVRRLQALIPLMLKHNGLPAIRIPTKAFGNTNTPKLPRSHQPSHQKNALPRRDGPAEEVASVADEEEEEAEFIDVEGSDSDQPPSPVEPPPTDEGWTTKKKKNKKNFTPKPPIAEAEPTPQSSQHTEKTEDPHIINYLLRRKNNRQEDTHQHKTTFSDILNKKGYKKDIIDAKKPTTSQSAVRQLARRGGLAT